MVKKKVNWIIDPSVGTTDFPKLESHSNIHTLLELNLPLNVDDIDILKKAHQKGFLVLTGDKKSGFSFKVVTDPNYKNTGVVVSHHKLDGVEIDDAATRLIKTVEFDDLIAARVELRLDHAKIYSKQKGKYEIKFDFD
jgi:hypothetical protein